MNDNLMCRIILNPETCTAEAIESIIRRFLIFKPAKMSGSELTRDKMRKFNEKSFFAGIEDEIRLRGRFILELEEGEDESKILFRSGDDPILNVEYRYDLYAEHQHQIMQTIDDVFVEYNARTGIARSSEENLWQNTENLSLYEYANRPTDHLRLVPHFAFDNQMMVDIEQFPGHSHQEYGLIFTSCWAMWFGHEFFKYIPKKSLQNFTDCYEQKELDNGALRILLYPNYLDYDDPDNRKRQWRFRRTVGIDEIAHHLATVPIVHENPDPTVQFLEGQFEHGGTRKSIYYLRNDGQNVIRSRADYMEIFEYDEEGNVLWTGKEKLEKTEK